MLQNLIQFPDQSTHVYLILTLDEILCVCNYKAKAKCNKKLLWNYFFLLEFKNILKIKDNRIVRIDINFPHLFFCFYIIL